jgi:hypothetical protein
LMNPEIARMPMPLQPIGAPAPKSAAKGAALQQALLL